MQVPNALEQLTRLTTEVTDLVRTMKQVKLKYMRDAGSHSEHQKAVAARLVDGMVRQLELAKMEVAKMQEIVEGQKQKDEKAA